MPAKVRLFSSSAIVFVANHLAQGVQHAQRLRDRGVGFHGRENAGAQMQNHPQGPKTQARRLPWVGGRGAGRGDIRSNILVCPGYWTTYITLRLGGFAAASSASTALWARVA